MIGNPRATASMLSQALGYRLWLRGTLENKPTEELEQIVEKYIPKVKRDDAIFYSGLALTFGGMLGTLVVGFFPELRDFTYLNIPLTMSGVLSSTVYGFFGPMLKNKYTREIAQSLIEERRTS